MVYEPTGVPAGTEKTALVEPELTIPEVTDVPICVPPFVTVNVTVPELTMPDGLVTVADKVTPCAAVLKTTEALTAAVVVDAGLTISEAEPLLAEKLPAPL